MILTKSRNRFWAEIFFRKSTEIMIAAGTSTVRNKLDVIDMESSTPSSGCIVARNAICDKMYALLKYYIILSQKIIYSMHISNNCVFQRKENQVRKYTKLWGKRQLRSAVCKPIGRIYGIRRTKVIYLQ